MITISNPHFIDGWQAYHANLPIAADPFLFEANPYRLWRCGWSTARMIDLAEQGIFELPGDMIASDDGPPSYRRIDKSPFAQGQVAYAKAIAIEDCPYEPHTTFAFDWRSGWFWQELHAPLLPLAANDGPEPVEQLAWLAGLLRWLRGLWS